MSQDHEKPAKDRTYTLPISLVLSYQPLNWNARLLSLSSLQFLYTSSYVMLSGMLRTLDTCIARLGLFIHSGLSPRKLKKTQVMASVFKRPA